MEATLKNGKKVVVRELSALDEVMVYNLVGQNYDEKNVLGAGVLQRYASALLSVVSVDDVQLDMPKTVEDVLKGLKQFSKRDWQEVLELSDKLNSFEPGE